MGRGDTIRPIYEGDSGDENDCKQPPQVQMTSATDRDNFRQGNLYPETRTGPPVGAEIVGD